MFYETATSEVTTDNHQYIDPATGTLTDFGAANFALISTANFFPIAKRVVDKTSSMMNSLYERMKRCGRTQTVKPDVERGLLDGVEENPVNTSEDRDNLYYSRFTHIFKPAASDPIAIPAKAQLDSNSVDSLEAQYDSDDDYQDALDSVPSENEPDDQRTYLHQSI